MGFWQNVGNFLFGADSPKVAAVEKALDTIKPNPRTVLDLGLRIRRYDAAIPTLTQADWQAW